jgi:hypothetical protein
MSGEKGLFSLKQWMRRSGAQQMHSADSTFLGINSGILIGFMTAFYTRDLDRKLRDMRENHAPLMFQNPVHSQPPLLFRAIEKAIPMPGIGRCRSLLQIIVL